MTEDRARTYRQMLAFLAGLGADLVGHDFARLASARQAITLESMDSGDLLHYQRVLEATIDHRTVLMDREAMRRELTEVVRERIARGLVLDKVAEIREHRRRTASLSERTRRAIEDGVPIIVEHDGRAWAVRAVYPDGHTTLRRCVSEDAAHLALRELRKGARVTEHLTEG